MIKCYLMGETSSLQKLQAFILPIPYLKIIGISEEESDDLTRIFSLQPDLVFADAELMYTSPEKLSAIKDFIPFVAFSHQEEDAYRAFECQAFDYLRLPLKLERFMICIQKFRRYRELLLKNTSFRTPKNDSFFIKVDQEGVREVLIHYAELVYIKAFQNYVILHTKDTQQYYAHCTLREMESNLPEDRFSRIHKSFIVNDDLIQSVEGDMIKMKYLTEVRLYVGNTYKKLFSSKKAKRMLVKQGTKFSPFFNN